MTYYLITTNEIPTAIIDDIAKEFLTPFNLCIKEVIDEGRAISYIDNPSVTTVGLIQEDDENFNNYSSIVDYAAIKVFNS